MCLSHLIYTVRPCLSHTCHAAPMPYSDHAVLLKVRAWHGRCMASVNQTRPHCVNQMGKTHSKPLAARHGRRRAWARHAMCKSAFSRSSFKNGCYFCSYCNHHQKTLTNFLKTFIMKFHENPSVGSGVVYMRTDEKSYTRQVGDILFTKHLGIISLQLSYATCK